MTYIGRLHKRIGQQMKEYQVLIDKMTTGVLILASTRIGEVQSRLGNILLCNQMAVSILSEPKV